MLSMAFLGQLVAELCGGPGRLRSLQTRFKAVSFPGDTITVTGCITAVVADHAELTLKATRQDGTVTLEGHATIGV
jgi:acyl dehydratase